MYIGTAVKIIPTVTPANHRAKYSTLMIGTAAIRPHEMADSTMPKSTVFLRPNRSRSAPANKGPMAAPSGVSELTHEDSCFVISRPFAVPSSNFPRDGDDQVSAQPAANAPMFTANEKTQTVQFKRRK